MSKGKILVVREDDDIYLPHHISSHVTAMEGQLWSKPSTVLSDYTGQIEEEDATGRFHTSMAFTRQAFEQVGGKSVRIVTHGEDRYDRTIGEVYVAGEKPEDSEKNVNATRVADGFAWHYVQYAPDSKELAAAEKTARKEKNGLWADRSPIAPWDWRTLSKEERDKLR